MLKILHVIAGLSPRYGGTTQAILTMVSALRSVGVQAEIAATDEDGRGGNLHVPLGTPLKQDGLVFYYFHCPMFRKYGVAPGLASWLVRNVARYHAVHVHGLFSFVAAPAAYACYRAAVPYIVRPSGELDDYSLKRRGTLKRAYLRAIGEPVLRKAAAVHCTSPLEESHIRALGLGAKTAVIPLGVAEPSRIGAGVGRIRAKYPEIGDRKIVLFMSRLVQKKGLDLLLSAIASLDRDDIFLVIAGAGPAEYERYVERLVRVHRLEQRTAFLGFVEGEEKEAAFADADLLALPSYDENFGLVVAEALMRGVPVLVSNRVSFWRELEREAAGLVVECDAQGVAAGLLRLIDDPVLRRQLAVHGRRFITRHSGWDQVTERLIVLYETIQATAGVA